MALIISLDDDDVKFQVKVTDCTTDTAFDVDDIEDEFMIFYKPDGTIITKDANLIVDSENPTESYVTYQNTEGSIFDLRGEWEYAAKITLVTTNGSAQTSQRRVFWVS